MNAATLVDKLPDLDALLAGCLGSSKLVERETESSRIISLTSEREKKFSISELFLLKKGEMISSEVGDIISNGDGSFSLDVTENRWYDSIYSIVDNNQLAMESAEWFCRRTSEMSPRSKYTLLKSLQNPEKYSDSESRAILEEFYGWLREGSDE